MTTRAPDPLARRVNRRDFLALVGTTMATAAAGIAAEKAAPLAAALGAMGASGIAPTGFVAHGAPLLALDPVKGADLLRWAEHLPRPRSILVISAHWERQPASLGPTLPVPLIYDFYGFPEKFYELTYAAPVSESLAKQVEGLLRGVEPVVRQPERGLDHGTWVPLRRMFPDASIPVLQLSLPTMEAGRLFRIGKALAPLRQDGVFILGSGNITHNLRMADGSANAKTPAWAAEFDAWTREMLVTANVDKLLDYKRLAPGVAMALPTHEHFVPLTVALGAAAADARRVKFPVEGFEFGSITRRSVQFG